MHPQHTKGVEAAKAGALGAAKLVERGAFLLVTQNVISSLNFHKALFRSGLLAGVWMVLFSELSLVAIVVSATCLVICVFNILGRCVALNTKSSIWVFSSILCDA